MPDPRSRITDGAKRNICPKCGLFDTKERREHCPKTDCALRYGAMKPVQYPDTLSKRVGNWLFGIFAGKR
jgi:hypothetical protein